MRLVLLSASIVALLATQAFANVPPDAPTITEPVVEGYVVNPSDVHMEAGPFSDADPGDTHFCTDWEIWTITPSERVWFGSCVTGPEKVHAHLGDGAFEGSHAGATQLLYETDYELHVRFRDDSGDPATEWSPYSMRGFHTGPQTQTFPLDLDDILATPTPQWLDDAAAPIDLPAGAVLRVEQKSGGLLLAITGMDGVSDEIDNPSSLPTHESARVRITSSGPNVALPASDLTFVTDEGEQVTVYLPSVALSGADEVVYWIAAGGATFVGSAGQTEPDFSTLARGAPVPWMVNLPGYVVEVVATGMRLPVNIAFVPNPSAAPDAPFYYVTELYGQIDVVTNAGDVSVYATNLLNFAPTGAFPGSGEQGTSGIVVDPATGDLFVAHLYDAGGPHYPRILRLHSEDGGLTAATQTTILDMAGESQGQSHFISNMTIGPDGKLYVHMGDGFETATAQNLGSFRGKILRMNLDGSAPADNPFFDNSNGITSRDYVYAYGVRNPFGGAWRTADGRHYIVENGPSRDRITQLVEGRNYLWDGSDSSMNNFALHLWNPAVGPVNMAFVQPETFGGSGFPAEMMDRGFITESGATWGSGPQSRGKRITMWEFDAAGNITNGPTDFIQYNGTGKATVVALAAGPDGLYFSDFYKDLDYSSPIDRGANILRIRFVGSADFTADVTEGPAPLLVQFTDTSSVQGATAWLWNFGDGATSTEQNPQHTYTSNGAYTVQLQVTSASGVSTIKKPAFIFVGERVRIAVIGGASSASAADGGIVSHLAALGYDATYFDDDPGNRPSAAEFAATHDLVIVSSSVASSNIAGEFQNQPVPLIHWESALNTAARVPLASSGNVVTDSQIDLLDNAHPVTAGLPLGTVNVFTGPTSFSIAQAPYGVDAQVLATRQGSPADAAIIVADAGDELLNGYIAPDKRVFLFFEDSSWLSATAEGRQILDQAVLWTAGAVTAAPTMQIISPVEGQAVVGDSLTVEWAAFGDLSSASHVHLRLDAGPIFMTDEFAGPHLFENVAPGPHAVSASLVDAGHQPLPNDEATDVVNYVQEAPVVPTDSIALPLARNWNGLVHAGEGGDPDAPDGYRSISDRGFVMGQADSIGGGSFAVSKSGLTYEFASQAGPALDMVMLGSRRSAGGGQAWDNADDNDSVGVAPSWDPTGGTGDVSSVVSSFPASEPLDGSFQLGLLFHASNGGASFNVTLGFDDATNVTVTVNAPDWFADFDPTTQTPDAGVASQAFFPGPLSGGDGFLAVGSVDNPQPDGPLNVVEARVTAASLLSGMGFDVADRRLNSLTFDQPVGGSGAAIGIYAASMTVPVCNCAGDVSGDAAINGADIGGFVDCLTVGGEGCGCADVDGAAGLDVNDVSAFVGLLLTGPGC